VSETIGPIFYLVCDVEASLSKVGEADRLQRRISRLSSVRQALHLLDAATHPKLDSPQPNFTGSVALWEGVQWLPGTVYANTALTSSFEKTPFNSWSHYTDAPIRVTNQAQRSQHVGRSGGLHTSLHLLGFQADVFPPDNLSAFLRLIDGILAALCLMLVLVLAALCRHPDALAFVLVMLAVCRHYGRGGDPDDHTFLPMRQHQRSLGRRPQS
jgi:hypothetical protein